MKYLLATACLLAAIAGGCATTERVSPPPPPVTQPPPNPPPPAASGAVSPSGHNCGYLSRLLNLGYRQLPEIRAEKRSNPSEWHAAFPDAWLADMIDVFGNSTEWWLSLVWFEGDTDDDVNTDRRLMAYMWDEVTPADVAWMNDRSPAWEHGRCYGYRR